MIKLIASDMDGTLIRDNGRIHHKIFPLIELLRSKRIIFAAASGRFYHQLDDNFKNVNSKMIFIAHNGALVKYNNNGDTIFSSPISLENITRVLNLQRNFGEEIFLACENIAYVVNPTREMNEVFGSYNIRRKIWYR